MTDLLLKHSFTDRAGREVYAIWKLSKCSECGHEQPTPTKQQIRIDLDNDHRIKAVVTDIE